MNELAVSSLTQPQRLNPLGTGAGIYDLLFRGESGYLIIWEMHSSSAPNANAFAASVDPDGACRHR